MGQQNFSILRSAAKFYAALFADLKSAKESIRIQIYAIDEGKVSLKLKDILAERAKAGVTVHLMYDSIGSYDMPKGYFDDLANSGAIVSEYHPINPRRAHRPFSISRLFHRNHRKLIIIDSQIYYLGGMNIGERFAEWEDLMVRGEGDPVDELEKAFDRVWKGKPSWPKLQRFPVDHEQAIQVCDCRPQFNNYPIKRLYLSAIKKARFRIWIAQAYFLPRRRFIKALAKAADRGVDVRIVIPDVSDVKIVDLAAWSVVGRLLKKKVRVFRFQNKILHAKMAIIDDDWLTLGTANLDSMSFYWNMELNLVIRDPEKVKMAADIFEDYESWSKEVNEGEPERRPLALRAFGRALYYYSWVL